MVERYDKNKLEQIIKIKLIFGSIVLVSGIIGFILISCNESFNNLVFQVLSTILVLIGMLILALMGIEVRKISIENSYIKLEKYIVQNDTYISLLYKIYLNNNLFNELEKRNIKLYSNFPIIWEEAFQLEIVNEDKKMIIIYYEDRIMCTVLKIDKYEFDIDEAKWKEFSVESFKTEVEVYNYIEERYNELLINQK